MFTIYLMECQDGNLNYTFTIPDIWHAKGSKLKLKQQHRVVFGKDNPIPHLLANEYYQPTSPNYPSLDSFVYDPNSHQVNAFQATVGVGLEHDLKSGEVYVFVLQVTENQLYPHTSSGLF